AGQSEFGGIDPMTFISLTQMAIAVFLFSLLPGPGFMAIMATGARSGFWRACFFLFGEVLGDVVYGGLAIFSLGMVATKMAPLLIWIRYLGAAYIIWLGVSYFLIKTPAAEDQQSQNPKTTGKSHKPNDPDRPLALLLSGSIIGLTNPKVILFYLSFFPQFIKLSEVTLWSGIGIIFIVFVSGMMGVMLVAKLGEVLGNSIKNLKFKQRLNWVSGSILILIGLYLVSNS
ncbi:MAG: LysE family translocator, partial [Alphaproteobacteria bacterium]|nr:LysE family translocator [Alphaproteobacteria bacterium]